MLKFYIVKRSEWNKEEIHNEIVRFDTYEDLERFLAYNRGYIEEIKTLDEATTYSFTHSNGHTATD